MTKILLGTTMLAGLLVAGVAQAADMARPVYKAPPVAYYNWSGCYIGGQAGWARARTEFINTANTTAFGDLDPGEGFRVSDSGGIAGGQIGCNFQSGQWVFGIEGQGSWLGVKTSFLNTVFGGATDDIFEVKSNWLASVAGRLGFANNNWLFYAKGGFAASGWRLSVTDVVGANQGSGSDRHTHTGFVVGTGIEYGLTPNWIFGVEYDYYSFSKESYQLNGTEQPGVRSYAFDFKPQNVHAVVGRISYKFY
jgi:outer membrane immunogenic protein